MTFRKKLKKILCAYVADHHLQCDNCSVYKTSCQLRKHRIIDLVREIVPEEKEIQKHFGCDREYNNQAKGHNNCRAEILRRLEEK